MYLTSRDIAAVAFCSALWGVLNAWISPTFFRLTRMPFLCDMLAFMVLVLAIWWTRKFGAASLVGVVVAAMAFMINPTAFQMVGFVTATIVFDIVTKLLTYERLFRDFTVGAAVLVAISVLCAALAGIIIGAFFMGYTALSAVLIWGGLHAIGGLIGGTIGVVIVKALMIRHVRPL